MIGDPHGLETGASQPFPPAYTQGPPGQRAPAAGDHRPLPPFFPAAEAAAAPSPGPWAARVEPPVLDSAGPPPPPRPGAPVTPIASGTIPADAIYMPDAEIPKRKAAEAVEDFADAVQRPLTTTDASVLVAARLELLARALRERGTSALQAGYGGDPLDAALSGLISGYIAGRAR